MNTAFELSSPTSQRVQSRSTSGAFTGFSFLTLPRPSGASRKRWGGSDQPARREFLPVAPRPESINVADLPRLLFLATQDGTPFYGYVWNNHIALKSSHQLTKLNKGDFVIFRGDYMFAGADGSAYNVCVHAWLNTPQFARPEYAPAPRDRGHPRRFSGH